MRKSSADILGFDMPGQLYDVYNLPEVGTLLEIGTLQGKSAVAWAEAFEKCNKIWEVITVDNYNDFRLEGFEHLHTTGKEQEQIVKENLKGWDNIYQLKGTFPVNIKPEQPTVLFYDGDHSMNMVKQALDTYNGVKYIYVDDYNFPGTKQAVDEHIIKHNKNLTLIDGIAFITDKEE
tara:strand:- start:232 stop:762 length:531 start_codon:yes stop_codon:yes gene_type:complete